MTSTSAEKPQGFIVMSVSGLYLDRNFRWRKRPALREAFVHSKESLVKGGAWADTAMVVMPAQYNPDTDFTESVGGKTTTYSKFLADALHHPDMAAGQEGDQTMARDSRKYC